MNGTIYRKDQPTTLQELLAQAGLQDNGSAVVPPQAQQAPQDGSATADSRLLALLTQPESQGPAPEVDKLSTWDKIRMTIGDSLGSAFQAYGAVLGGGSPPPLSNNYGKFLARQDQQKADLADWQKRLAESQREGKLRGAQYIMGKQAKDQARADEAAALKESRAYQQQVVKDATKQRAEEQAVENAANLAKFNDNKTWDLEMEKVRYGHEQAVAGIRAKVSEGDKSAAEDKKALGGIYETIGMLAGTAKQNLADGKTTPEELTTLVRREIDKSMVSPEARKAAELYANMELGPIFRELEMEKQNQDLAAGSPQVQGQGILQRLGSVRTPQRY